MNRQSLKNLWRFIVEIGFYDDSQVPKGIWVENVYKVRDAYYSDLENGIELNEDVYEFLDRHGIEWK
jgi:hypothetical protein